MNDVGSSISGQNTDPVQSLCADRQLSRLGSHQSTLMRRRSGSVLWRRVLVDMRLLVSVTPPIFALNFPVGGEDCRCMDGNLL
ncbi:hypothetical protein DL89DRAFT_268773, partial [Linderina pennispora]